MPRIAVLVIAVAPPFAPRNAAKHFAKVDNREVFMRTIELYANRDSVIQRLLVVSPDDLQTVQTKYSAHLGFQGVSVTGGGADWFSCVARGLEKLSADSDTVFVHDASRPAIPFTLLDAMESALDKVGPSGGAVVPVVPVHGAFANVTGKAIEGNDAYVDLAGLVEVQSPQAFTRPLLEAAYARRVELTASAPISDDADLCLAHDPNTRVITVTGSRYNARTDSEEALRLAGDFLKHLPKAKSKAPLSPFDEAQW